jgi:hypothetical protein
MKTHVRLVIELYLSPRNDATRYVNENFPKMTRLGNHAGCIYVSSLPCANVCLATFVAVQSSYMWVRLVT